MLNEELEHRLGKYESMLSIQCREAERLELQRQYDEFLAKGGKPQEIPWGVSAKDHWFGQPVNAEKYESMHNRLGRKS